MTIHSAIKWMVSFIVTVIFILHAGGWWSWSFMERMEYIAYDARLNLNLHDSVDPRVVIISIDERSLREEGQWPWSRSRLADLVRILFDQYQVAVLGFDMVFSEKESTDAIVKALTTSSSSATVRLRSELARLRYLLDPDRRFAMALRNRPVVLGYFFNTYASSADAEIRFGQLPEAVGSVRNLGANDTVLIEGVGYGANLPLLQKSAQSSGFFNSPLVDRDGVFRRVPLLMRFKDQLYEHLSLAVVRTLLGQPPLEFIMAAGYGGDAQNRRLEAVQFGGFRIPVDELGAVLVPYRGAQGSFPYVSATDVLSGQVDPQILNGAIALVGTTAAGLLDMRATPVQNVYPGVELNANLIVGLLDQSFKNRPPYIAGLEMTQLALVGILAALASLLTPLRALLLNMLVAMVLIGFNNYFWQVYEIVIPLASALALLLALYVIHTSYNVFIESRRERQLKKKFGWYVPEDLVDEMSKRGDNYSLEGESRQMTVLFSDIEGFTSISENLEPRELTELMQLFLTPLTEVIHHRRGTIDKYIGDAIMAFWGAPVHDPEHARHAVEAALGMVKRLQELEGEFHARGWSSLKIRVGINTGMMSVGNMGSKFRMSYTVMGDAVNLASRLESAAKQYGVSIIIGEHTRMLVPEFICRELDWVQVKGRQQPVIIYEPLGLSKDVSPELLEELVEYDKALQAYRVGDWALAEQAFNQLMKDYLENPLYEMYWGRAVANSVTYSLSEQEWDGVFELKSK